jgi:hypothetical protein
MRGGGPVEAGSGRIRRVRRRFASPGRPRPEGVEPLRRVVRPRTLRARCLRFRCRGSGPGLLVRPTTPGAPGFPADGEGVSESLRPPERLADLRELVTVWIRMAQNH